MKGFAGRAAIWAGWAISLFFVGWAAMKMDMAKVGAALVMADYRWLIPPAILNVAILYVRAIRWVHFIAPVKVVPVMSSFSAISIGYMANMVLPARIGELVRAYALAKRERISGSAALGTVVMERAVDGLSVVVMMLIIFALVDPPEGKLEFFNSLRLAGMATAAFFIAFSFGVYLFHKQVRAMVWLIDALTGMLPDQYGPKVRTILDSFRQGFNALDHGHRIAKIVLWSAVAWSTAGLYNYCFFRAFGLPVPFLGCYLVVLAQVFGVMIPSAPAFVGVYHAATIAGLSFYGVDPELALSVALVAHAIFFITFTIPGLVFLWLEQYSLSEIQHAADEEG